MEEILNTSPAETVQVVDIQFRPGQKIYFFDPADVPCTAGDHVIIDTARGEEFGICAGGVHDIPVKEVVSPLRKVLRIASTQDERIVAENRARENRASEVCIQKIAAHGLDMQLVSAECAFDGSKILFYFTADERVDFRELVKDLASVFHTRIELRQIGVRDKAKMVGGLGICGRPFCCASFLDDFQPVSIKMAKTQNLSLNPTKISGTCGRLMCCLKYEQDTYEDLIRSSPKAESFVDTVDGRGTVVEVDVLRQRVKVRMENNPETIGVYPNDEIAILRSGKPKKTDAPIPADLAPISGSGKRVKREKAEEDAILLEPIRFRYSTESVVDEPETVPEEVTEEVIPEEVTEAAPRESRRSRRRNRGERPEKTEKAEMIEKTEQAAPEAPTEAPEAAEAKPEHRPRRRRPDRRRKPEGEQPAEKAKAAPAPEAAPAADGPENSEAKRRRRPNYRRHRRPKAPSGE